MPDINTYANDLFLDFVDAVHEELKHVLTQEFGDDWLTKGVRKHFKADYFSRIEEMLRSPMRVVDMGKNEEDIYGIEHLWNIINGNWILFQNFFGTRRVDKERTEVYLGEITELRHNLAHRRNKHLLQKSQLIRIVEDFRIVLAALESNRAEKFAEVVDSLISGTTPWGMPLGGKLPHSDEMYAEFIGRPKQLEGLWEWLSSDRSRVSVYGYGGAGKSALAYKFAREVRDSSDDRFEAVCWVSAKRWEFVDGTVQERSADFTDLDSLVKAIWIALYDEIPEKPTQEGLVDELKTTPILLVVDDFDTVLEDDDLSDFLLHDLRDAGTRIIYTSRQHVQATRNIDVPPFSDEELKEFIKQRCGDYGADPEPCLERIEPIKNVTGAYPLFVNDLIRQAAMEGIINAMGTWSQRKGDAAREYSLRRQVEHLGGGCKEVLIALSVANEALVSVEISNIAGLADRDTEAGLRSLADWKLVNRVLDDNSSAPAYRMDANTARLVQQIFGREPIWKTIFERFKVRTDERVPVAKKRAISKVISQTKVIARSRSIASIQEAIQHLLEEMTGELTHSPDLYRELGMLYSKLPLDVENFRKARENFRKSDEFGASEIYPYVGTYTNWIALEKSIAELMKGQNALFVAEQWKACGEVCELGMKRCGQSRILCSEAGYAASREARARNTANNFRDAEVDYAKAIDWYKKALESPRHDEFPVNDQAIYRGLVLAYEGLGDEEELRKILLEWYKVAGGSLQYFDREYRWLVRRYPRLQTVPQFRRLHST
jgi:tetratricopeptide (TPR) repeat protein